MMNPQSNGQAQPEQLRLTEEALNKEFSIKFKRKELNVIYNLINQKDLNFQFGAYKTMKETFEVMQGIITKITGPVVALSNQDYEQQEPPVVVN